VCPCHRRATCLTSPSFSPSTDSEHKKVKEFLHTLITVLVALNEKLRLIGRGFPFALLGSGTVGAGRLYWLDRLRGERVLSPTSSLA
jgi:hypothetical protein